jgi:hypothetical protein
MVRATPFRCRLLPAPSPPPHFISILYAVSATPFSSIFCLRHPGHPNSMQSCACAIPATPIQCRISPAPSLPPQFSAVLRLRHPRHPHSVPHFACAILATHFGAVCCPRHPGQPISAASLAGHSNPRGPTRSPCRGTLQLRKGKSRKRPLVLLACNAEAWKGRGSHYQLHAQRT